MHAEIQRRFAQRCLIWNENVICLSRNMPTPYALITLKPYQRSPINKPRTDQQLLIIQQGCTDICKLPETFFYQNKDEANERRMDFLSLKTKNNIP